MSNTHSHEAHRRSRREHRKSPVTKARAIGATVVAAAGIGISQTELFKEAAFGPKGRAVPTHIQRYDNAHGIKGSRFYASEGNAPASTQTGENTVGLEYDQRTDQGVFGFADRHLEGNPNDHLLELKAQLEAAGREGYNVPDGFVFEVNPSELDNPKDPQIINSADQP